MAQGGFTELIYDSTQSPIGVSETDRVDRLLGIGTDGTAKVVGITGNYKVLVGGDIVNDHTTGNALTNKMYSCKATYSLIGSKIVADADKDDPSVVGEDAKTYSCKAIRSLVSEAGGGGYWTLSNSFIQPEYNLSMGNKTIWFGGQQQGAPSFTLTIGNPASGSSAGISLRCGADIYSASCIEAASSFIATTLKLHDSADNVTGTISCVYQPAGIGDHLSSDLKIQAPSFYESSDASLKENVAPLSESALSAAASVPLVEFDWKSDGTHSYGTIAQECEKHMPEVVGMGADGKKSVNYIALLCAKVAALEKEVAELKSKVQ
jgi:hypothetical protein